MKIIFVLDDMGIGGLQRVNATISEELVKDNDVELIAIKDSHEMINTKVPVRILIKNKSTKIWYFVVRGVNYIFKKLFGVSTDIVNKVNFSKLDRVISEKKPDVVILNGTSLLLLNKIKNKYSQIKLFAWMHNNYDIYFNSYFKYNKSLLIESLKSANKVIVLNNNDFKDYSKFSNNVVKIHNPITLDNVHHEISNLRSHTIVFVGRIDVFHKGLDYLVEVASHLPADWIIKIAGSGDQKLIKEFESLIEKHNVKDKVLLEGNLEGNSLRHHYLNSSIYIMTSRYEGLPLVLMEAMNFGLPIVAFNQSGSSEVLDHGKYGKLIPNGNVDLFYKALLELIRSPELRLEYQKKSLARVKDFSVDKISNEWKACLNGIS